MSTPFADLEAEAMKLPHEDRLRLADHLLASLASNEVEDIDEAWAEELERRLVDSEAGREKLVPSEEAVHRARSALR